MLSEEIRQIVEKGEYECYGLRIDDNSAYRVGDICKNSHQWWQDDPEDGSEYVKEMECWDGGELPGTCAIEIIDGNIDQALKDVCTYFGDNLYLIAGNIFEGGNDIGEVIISDAIVLLTGKKPQKM